jgi:hypothetical protein
METLIFLLTVAAIYTIVAVLAMLAINEADKGG